MACYGGRLVRLCSTLVRSVFPPVSQATPSAPPRSAAWQRVLLVY